MQQAGHFQKLLPLGVEGVVAAAQLGQLLVVAVEPGKRRRLRVGVSPLFGERLLETGDLLAERLLQRGALVVGFGEPAFQLGELLVGRELVVVRLARQFQVGQQSLAIGLVCRFLLGLPGGRFNQRLFQPSRLGDVPKRDEHRRDRVGRARVGIGVQLEGVTRAGEADQIDFKRTALAAQCAVEEGLTGLAFLGLHRVHQRGAEDLLERLSAEQGQTSFVDGEEGAVFVDAGQSDRLSLEDRPKMGLRLNRQIDAHSWGPRSFAHGMAIGRKSREDY